MKKGIIDHMRDIVEQKSRKRVKFEDGTTMIDMMTAKAIVLVYDAFNDKNKALMTERMKTKIGFLKVSNFCFSKVKFC